MLIALPWYLESNPESRDLLSQLKSKLMGPLEPGSLALGGKAVCKMRDSFPREKSLRPQERKIRFMSLHQTPSLHKVPQVFNIQTRKADNGLVYIISSQNFTYSKLDQA